MVHFNIRWYTLYQHEVVQFPLGGVHFNMRWYTSTLGGTFQHEVVQFALGGALQHEVVHFNIRWYSSTLSGTLPYLVVHFTMRYNYSIFQHEVYSKVAV